VGGRSADYPPELRERAVWMVAQVATGVPLGFVGDLRGSAEAGHRRFTPCLPGMAFDTVSLS
jgi:hypothetical protein